MINFVKEHKIKIMKFYYILIACCLTLLACQDTASKSDLQPLDLLQYGIPITILAPDSVAVKSGNLSFSQDVTIKGEEPGYDIQIFGYDATTTNPETVKAEQLADIKSNRYFSKIVQEDPAGFIYEIALDSTNLNYGFKHIRIQGDKEYVFQTAMVGSFNLEDTKRMYEAVQKK